MQSRPLTRNLIFAAVAGVAVWANYTVVEQTRVTGARLHVVEKRINADRARLAELQTQYMALSSPDRIQMLAQSELGMTDTPTVQLSSMQMLPSRGGNDQNHNREVVTSVPTQVPGAPSQEIVKISAHAEN